jgi:anti-sigma regulatory factor (Ser/Thr protein kinase)
LGIRLGLNELIINAIEHGNLGISYQEKTELLTQGVDEYFELLRIRCENPEYQKKFVTIKFHCQSDSARWEIIDAGTGFDWRNLQSPLDELTTGHPHGRGIFLARCQFNTLEFNEEGNKVIATLKF